jgi:hypothetical protein
MSKYVLDTTGLILFAVWAPVGYWAAFRTESVLRLANRKREEPFARWEVMVLKVPAMVFALGATLWILISIGVRFLG